MEGRKAKRWRDGEKQMNPGSTSRVTEPSAFSFYLSSLFSVAYNRNMLHIMVT